MTVRVASFNIHNGQDVRHDFSILAEDILGSGAEVIGLQEVDIDTKRNKNQDTLAELAKHTGYEYYCYAKTEDFSGGQYGIGILSKYPILEYDYFYLPRGTDTEKRAVQYTRIEVDGGEFHFFNSHFGFSIPDTELFQTIDNYIDKKNLPSFAIVGDFNTEVFAATASVFPHSTLAITQDNFVNTYKEIFSIDNIVASKGLTLTDFQVVDTFASDHSDHKLIAATLMLETEKKQ